MNRKIIAVLLAGVMALAAIPALAGKFASKDYNSSKSNTTLSISQINEEVGNILLRYGVGGAEINEVTDALAVGISEDELNKMLSGAGINDEGIQEIHIKFDGLGIGIEIDKEKIWTDYNVHDPGIKIDDKDDIVPQGKDYNTSRTRTKRAIDTNKVEEGLRPIRKIRPSPAITPQQRGDSFFDVFVELKVFIEVIAKDANLTKADAKRVIDTLMKVEPAFTIDENGLQEARKAELIEAIASGANLTKAGAKRALDAFVSAAGKSLRGGKRVALVGFGSFSISKRKARTGRNSQTGGTIQIPAKKVVRFKAGADLSKTVAGIKQKETEFHDASKNTIRNIRAAAPEERKNLIDELRASRGTFQTEIVSMNLKIRENAKELRENFRENVGTTGADWDYKRTARIAAAHGKGLRMLNRFRSAMSRFDHILGRLESRAEKLEARGYQVDSFFDVFTSIEEAKNIQLENEVKLEELKAKYESLLGGENPQGIGNEAREIARELKTEIRALHTKLREIAEEIKLAMANFNSSRSNKSEN